MYSDKKVLELIKILKDRGDIRFEKEFCESAGLLPQNLSRIRNGHAHFTADHIRNVCIAYKVNANWIFGFDEKVLRA
jgi:hypothetical protein